MSDKTAILVTGATGKQGGACITALLDSPQASSLEIRFLTRNPSSASASKLTNRGAKAYKADLLNPASISTALQGVQLAFLVTDNMQGVDKEEQMGKTFIDEANKQGVRHIVFTSVCAADSATQVPHFNSKYQVEKHLIASGLSYTILRPVAFMDNFPAEAGFKRFMTVGAFYAFSAWKPYQFIACEDIGIFGAKALLDPINSSFANKTIDLSAGEYTFEQVREAYAKAQGQIPWFASLFPSQLVYILPYDLKMMMFYFRQGGYPKVDIPALKRAHPDLLSLEGWVRKNSGRKAE